MPWLPKTLYESLPYALLLTGLVLAAVVFVSATQWLQTALLILASIAGVIGLVLLLKRRDYRLSRSRIKYDRLD